MKVILTKKNLQTKVALDTLDTIGVDLATLLKNIPKELLTVNESLKCSECNFNSDKRESLMIHMDYVHSLTFHTCNICGTKTKTDEALLFHTEKRHGDEKVLSEESDKPEMKAKVNVKTELIEDLKVKLYLSRNIEGLEESFIPTVEHSTKLVFMMEQTEQSGCSDGFDDGISIPVIGEEDTEEKEKVEEKRSEEMSSEEASEAVSESQITAMKKTFEWRCLESESKVKQFLENELPDGFEYVVNRFKMIGESDIPHESKFEARFLVGVCSDEDATRFVHELEVKTGTNFNLASFSRAGKKNWKQTTLKCSRNVKTQTSPESTKAKGKGAGQGRVKGEERQKGKNMNCTTKMSTTLKPCNLNHTGENPTCFKLAVSLNYDHTHAVDSSNSWNFLDVEEPARLRLLQLFEEGMTPSKAKRVFEDELREKHGDEWLEISSKRSINPDTNYVFNLHTQYWKDKFGTINGPDSYQKATDFIEKYNKKAGTEVASIRQLTCGSVVVVVVDELSKRVHTTVPQSGQIVFIDGTGSLDRMNHQLVKLMTESPVGGLPLGFMILSDQTEKTLDAGFEDLKKLIPEKAFYGRGAGRGPELIMTDDDSVRNMELH